MRLKDIMKDKPRISKEVKELRAELKDIEKRIKALSETDKEFVLRDYVKKEPKKRQPTEWELFMEKHGIRAVCDKCGCVQTYMHALENGKPRRRCVDCGHTFNPFVGTIAQGSHLPLNVQIALVYYTINNFSLTDIQQNLRTDYGIELTQGSIISNRHKILAAIEHRFAMPKLSGVIKVDECCFRECQKGAKTLINTVPTAVAERIARTKEKKVPSQLGTFGNEFVCVVTAIDNKGHIAAVVTGLSRISALDFESYFGDYLGDISFLCSDGFSAYHKYCEEHAIPHYIKPSTMDKDIRKEEREWEETHNGEKISREDIKKKKYENQELDRIENYGRLTQAEFEELKSRKRLTLDDIDAFHRQLKRHINKNMTGVSAVYLHLYISLYVFKHNWKKDHKTPLTSYADAEMLYAELVGANGRFIQSADWKNRDILAMRRTPAQHITRLNTFTEKARELSNERGFVFDGNNKLTHFNKRVYFRTATLTQLRAICKEYKVKDYTTTKSKEELARRICALPEVNEIFVRLLMADTVNAPLTDRVVELLREEGQGNQIR